MIKTRLATPEERYKWNYVVKKCDNGTVFHTWEYMNVIESGFGSQVYPIIAEDEREIVGVLPTFTRAYLNSTNIGSKSRKIHDALPFLSNRIQVLRSPYPNTWGYGGACTISNNFEAVTALYKYMEEIIKTDRRIIDCRISPLELGNKKKIFIAANGYMTNDRQTAIIDLTKSEDELWNALRENHRNALNQAKKKGLYVEKTTKKEGLKDYYGFLIDLEKRAGVPLDQFAYYEAIWDILVPEHMAEFFLVKKENENIGGFVNFYYKDMAFLGQYSFPRKFSKLRGGNLHYWHSIINSKNRGCETLDLGGLPHDKSSGLYFFKSGFGGYTKELKEYRKRYRLKLVRDLKHRIKRKRDVNNDRN